MNRHFALHAEVLAGLHQPDAEERLPGPVDRHTRGERVFRRKQPFGQPKAIFRCVFRQRQQETRRFKRDNFFLLEILAAIENMRFARLVVGHHHDSRVIVRTIEIRLIHRFFQYLDELRFDLFLEVRFQILLAFRLRFRIGIECQFASGLIGETFLACHS